MNVGLLIYKGVYLKFTLNVVNTTQPQLRTLNPIDFNGGVHAFLLKSTGQKVPNLDRVIP